MATWGKVSGYDREGNASRKDTPTFVLWVEKEQEWFWKEGRGQPVSVNIQVHPV